ncbi:MAG: hypothetical protein QW575_04470 [Thermoproteota archaeon]
MKSKKQRRNKILLAIIIALTWAIPSIKVIEGLLLLPLTLAPIVEIVLIGAGICGLTALTLNVLEARK